MKSLKNMTDSDLRMAVWNARNNAELTKLEAEQARRLAVRASATSRLIESVAAKHNIDLQAELAKSDAVEAALARLGCRR